MTLVITLLCAVKCNTRIFQSHSVLDRNILKWEIIVQIVKVSLNMTKEKPDASAKRQRYVTGCPYLSVLTRPNHKMQGISKIRVQR